MLCKCVKSLNAIRPTSSFSSLQLERRRVGGSRAPLRLGKRRVSCLGLLAVPPFGRTERGAGHVSPASQRATSANSDAPSTARAVGQRKGSEARIDLRLAIVYTVRDGLIVRGREFASSEEALEAAGLSD